MKAGVFNIQKKTGEQLLSMWRQLIVVGHGLIPYRDWEAMIRYVRWADMLWKDSYNGVFGVRGRVQVALRHLRVCITPCDTTPRATEADFDLMDELAEELMDSLHASSFIKKVGKVLPCCHKRGILGTAASICHAYA